MATWTTPPDFQNGVVVDEDDLDALSQNLIYLKERGGVIAINIGDRTNIPNTGLYPVAFQAGYDMTITGYDLVANTTGSVQLDIWVDSYENYPPTDADSITASAPPSLSDAQKSTDSTLADWTVDIDEGEIFFINIDSVTTLTWFALFLKFDKR